MKRQFLLFITAITALNSFIIGNQPAMAFGQNDEEWVYQIQTSTDTEYITTSPIQKSLKKTIKKGKWKKISYPIPPTDTNISIKKEIKYAIDHQLNIYDRKNKKVLIHIPEKVKAQLSKHTRDLRTKHYGQRITWSEANTLLPRYSIFTVLDMDTGLSFQVQRRAGSYHADVQPLSKEDTKTMKTIYRGTWSWDRRAILILSENGKYAASMHGMPHGKGALKNGFPGHFCIHFQDSITHKSRKMDHAHSIMVKKASGDWLDYTQKLSPQEIVDAAILSIHQHDWFILSSILDDKNRLIFEKHKSYLEEIELIKRLSDLSEDNRDFEGKLDYPIKVKVYIHRGGNQSESRLVTFHLYRPSLEEPWTIDLDSLVNQL